MTWDNAVAWADSLTIGGFTDWRLPNAQNQDGSGPCLGFGCTGSEMGHLYYTELRNVAVTGGCTIGIDCGLVNTGPFSNLQADYYWSGTGSAPVIVGGQLVFTVWFFNPVTGNQDAENKLQNFFPWAVRSGDVPDNTNPIPEPSTMLLFGTGLAWLAAWRYRKSQKV